MKISRISYKSQRHRFRSSFRRKNDNLEQQAQALFKSWFVDFEPYKDGKFIESELGMIPKGWAVYQAEDIYEINIGKTPPRKDSHWFSNSESCNTKWVSISDMGACGMFIGDSNEYLTPQAIQKFNLIVVPKDTILVSFKLTIGRVAVASTELTTNEAIARFYLPQDYYREFTYFTLKNYDYETLGSTSSIAIAVNSKIIKNMPILMPTKNVIQKYHVTTEGLFNQILRNTEEIKKLIMLRDSLLPKLMSGELKFE